jgi:hypothetical protein
MSGELTYEDGDGFMLCGCGHFHLPGTACGRYWFYPVVRQSRECGCTQWWTPTQEDR